MSGALREAMGHIRGSDGVLIRGALFLKLVSAWEGFLKEDRGDEEGMVLRLHERTADPLEVKHSLRR
jgi:hypothetical protein